MISRERLAELKALEESGYETYTKKRHEAFEDAVFEAFPELIEEVERLREALGNVMLGPQAKVDLGFGNYHDIAREALEGKKPNQERKENAKKR